ncbi:hypothetical protein UlMin_026304 [Ulmus minor]
MFALFIESEFIELATKIENNLAKEEKDIQEEDVKVGQELVDIDFVWEEFEARKDLVGFISTLDPFHAYLVGKLPCSLGVILMLMLSAGEKLHMLVWHIYNSISHPSLFADMQSLCALSPSIGVLVGFSISGIFKFIIVGYSMWMTLKCPSVWRPYLYMYLSLALSLNILEVMFYRYTNSKDRPDHPFRDMFFWTQLFYGLSGMLNLMLVLRLNLKFSLTDYFLVVIDESVSQMIGRMKWMPLLVISLKLHLSSIVVLLKNLHPYCSPATIKLVLVTTAWERDPTGVPIFVEDTAPEFVV